MSVGTALHHHILGLSILGASGRPATNCDGFAKTEVPLAQQLGPWEQPSHQTWCDDFCVVNDLKCGMQIGRFTPIH